MAGQDEDEAESGGEHEVAEDGDGASPGPAGGEPQVVEVVEAQTSAEAQASAEARPSSAEARPSTAEDENPGGDGADAGADDESSDDGPPPLKRQMTLGKYKGFGFD